MVKSFTQDEARAWATRQMGRVLFLWFLQAKRWLGEPGGQGSPTYLLDLWAKPFPETDEGEYYRGILSPMFFDAMATGSSSRSEHPVLGFVPYLNGGLFRRSALEDRINDAGEVTLPDEVFDPRTKGRLAPEPALPIPLHHQGVHAGRPVRGPRPGAAGPRLREPLPGRRAARHRHLLHAA